MTGRRPVDLATVRRLAGEVERAGPGDVLVVDGGGRETALAGELFAPSTLRFTV